MKKPPQTRWLFCLHNHQQNQFVHQMTAEVAKHSVLNAIFSIETTEHKAETAVQEETAEQNQRRQSAEKGEGSRKMSCGKKKSDGDIDSNRNPLRNFIFAAFSCEAFPQNENQQTHQEQTHH